MTLPARGGDIAETVLITGGRGTLGRSLTPRLLAEGAHVRLLDVDGSSREPDAEGVETLVVDVRDAAAVRAAMEGVDSVVHAAAWHGIHLREHPARDFFELNVRGTFHVFEAAADARIDRVVLASTMGVYGESRRREDGRAVRVHEDLPLLPGDVYGASKVLAEELAGYYDRARAVRSVALRFGMFVPEPFDHTGIRFLYGGVDQGDVARAVQAALHALRSREPGSFTGYNIESAVPYGDEDASELPRDPLAVIRRHWPDAPDLMAEAGIAPWGPVGEWFPIDKAERELGWRPAIGFSEFLAALRDRRETLGPDSILREGA